jgi:hypothetical protein
MMLVVCSSLDCLTVTRILSQSADELVSLVGERSDFYPNRYSCPRCDTPASVVYEGNVDPNQFKDFSVMELEAQDYFRFLMGVGLPEEQDCRIEVLQSIFHENKVKNIAGHSISGTKRFCVDWLEMENGTKLYFGSSTNGATIYRITKKPEYTKKALEDAG